MTTTNFDAKHNRPRRSATSKADMHRSMGGAKHRDELAQMAFEEGIKEGKRGAQRPKPAQRRRSSGAASKIARSAARPARAGVRQGIRQLQAPVQQQVAGGVKILGLMVGLTMLYLVLTTNEKPEFTGKVGGLIATPARALGWLTAHDKSIPYGGN